MADTDLIARQLLSDLKRDFGLTDEQAAGVVGNLMHESAGFQTLQEVNPTVPGSAGGFGFAQWTGDRRKDFDRYVEGAGLDRNSYAANYGFLKHELENNRYERNQFNKVKKADTAAEAARIVSENYLRPGIPRNESRVRYAEQALSYADMPVPPAEIPNTVGTALSTVPTPPRTVMPPRPAQQPRSVQIQRDQNAALNDRLAAAEPDAAPARMAPRSDMTEPGGVNSVFANLPAQEAGAQSALARLLGASQPRAIPAMPTGVAQSYAGQDRAPRPVTPMSRAPISYASQERAPRPAARAIPAMPTNVAQSYAGQDRAPAMARQAPVPADAYDRVTARLNAQPAIVRLPELPPSTLGQPPSTRVVQSVPMPPRNPQISASDMARGRNGYQTIASIPTRPQSYAGQEAAPPSQQFTRAAAFSGGAQTPYAGMVPPITSLPPLPPLQGFDVPNKDQTRLAEAQFPMAPGGIMPPVIGMPPMPYARPTRATALPPMPQPRPQYSRPVYAQPQQRVSLLPVFNNNGRQPLRVVVNGGMSAPSQGGGGSSSGGSSGTGNGAPRRSGFDGALQDVFNREGARSYDPDTNSWR